MAKIRVLLDACVLLPYQLSDLLLRLADAELYEPLWSEDILTEVERNLTTTFKIPLEKASRRLNHMRAAFPNAIVDGYDHLVAAMTNDQKDRHVAAAAVRGGAALIVTANLRDFPPNTLAQYDIEAIHPDDFLQDQLDLSSTITVACLQQQRAAYTRPQFTFTEFYLSLAQTVPNFSRRAAAVEQGHWQSDDPLPLAIAPEDQTLQAFFPDGDPDPFNPLGAAFLWWEALLEKSEFLTALHNLTWHPPAWGDFEDALNRLSATGMMQFVRTMPRRRRHRLRQVHAQCRPPHAGVRRGSPGTRPDPHDGAVPGPPLACMGTLRRSLPHLHGGQRLSRTQLLPIRPLTGPTRFSGRSRRVPKTFVIGTTERGGMAGA